MCKLVHICLEGRAVNGVPVEVIVRVLVHSFIAQLVKVFLLATFCLSKSNGFPYELYQFPNLSFGFFWKNRKNGLKFPDPTYRKP